MNARRRPPLESLHHALKSWDPVRREAAPSPEEAALWRRRMLAERTARRRAGVTAWRPALATVAAVLVLVLLHDRGPAPMVSEPPGGAHTDPQVAAGTVDRRLEAGADRPPGAASTRTEPGEGTRTAPAGGSEADEARSLPRSQDAGEPADDEGSGPAHVSRRAGVADSAVPPLRTAAPASGESAESPADRSPRVVVIAPAGEASPERVVAPAEPALAERIADSRTGSGTRPLTAAPPLSAAPAVPAERPAFREVQFIAPGGTRIVWLIAAGSEPTDHSDQEDT